MKVLAFLCIFSGSQILLSAPKFWLTPKSQRFMPENKLSELDPMVPVNLSEAEFENVLTQVEEYYSPLVKRLYKANLFVTRDWEDSTVNAYATRSGNNWEVHMYGGLARRPEITQDGFAMVACHEVGHHLGGFPYVQSWAANEGQSDYFSSISCARHLWKADSAKNAAAEKNIPDYPKKLCDGAWKLQEERNLCYRIALAGKSLADLLSGSSAKFETPSKIIVKRTNNAHPAGQCRLDTYLAGALCKVNFNQELIPKTEKESSKVSCLQSLKQVGFRPVCWFKAKI